MTSKETVLRSRFHFSCCFKKSALDILALEPKRDLSLSELFLFNSIINIILSKICLLRFSKLGIFDDNVVISFL